MSLSYAATDTTEPTVIGDDEELSSTAYGSAYYLQDSYLDSLNRTRGGGGGGSGADGVRGSSSRSRTFGEGEEVDDGGSGRRTEAGSSSYDGVELVVRFDVRPAFFLSGNDFPVGEAEAVAGRRENIVPSDGGEERTAVTTQEATAQKDDNDVAALVTSHLGSAADLDIIVPVVSEECAMAQYALKGSAELAELKRNLESERATREAMDTSKSDYTQLLKKELRTGAITRSAAEAVPFGSAQSLYGGNSNNCSGTGGALESSEKATSKKWEGERDPFATRGVVFDPTRGTVNVSRRQFHRSMRRPESGDDGIVEGEDGEDGSSTREEEEILRYRIRVEKARMLASSAVATGPVARGDAGSDVFEARDAECDTRRQAKRRREEKLEVIAASSAAVGQGSSAHLAILDKQRELPIYKCKEALLRLIGENAVTIVVGETGSGKTTQLVQYLYQRRYAGDGKMIGCTQPRRLAAVGVARRVSEEMACVLGTTVGYAIHLDDTTSEATRIKFMTDGVLLRELVRDPDLSPYSVLMLDEAHERSVDTDVLLGVLKQVVQRRSDLKVIVTSATMDIHKFSRFFNNAPHFIIPGQTFEVTVQYSPTMVHDYVAEAVFRVCELHVRTSVDGKNDVLVFMTGRDDVFGTCELIRRRLLDVGEQWLRTLIILPCLSEASSAIGGCDSLGVLHETPSGFRKCVVATNVAETSLTIDGIRFVIDCGFMKTNVFRPKIGMNTLRRYPISQAQANQRKGRAGRTTEGVCFRLFTERQYEEEMLPASVPEIQRSSIDSVVLLLKSIGVHRLVDFDFMDPPPAANLRSSMWHLWMQGFLDDNGAITNDGRLALEFPLSPALARLLVESAKAGCAYEVTRIVSMIAADTKALFDLPQGREDAARQCHSRFYSNDSDHLTLLNVFTQFNEHARSRQWAADHFVNSSVLFRALDVHQQLMERMRRLSISVKSCGQANIDVVRECIARAFFLQSARRSGSNWSEYRLLLNAGVTCFIHPSSAVGSRVETPQYVVYNDLLLTSREFLVLVTAVEAQWLVSGSRGGLFSIKRGAGKAQNGPYAMPSTLSSTSSAQTGEGTAIGHTLYPATRTTLPQMRTPAPAQEVVRQALLDATDTPSSRSHPRQLQPALPVSKTSFVFGKKRPNI